MGYLRKKTIPNNETYLLMISSQHTKNKYIPMEMVRKKLTL